MISRRETMATSSSSMFESGGCSRHRLPQITTCATCHQTLVDQVDSGGGDGDEVEGLNHRHHFHHHRRPRSSVNHHHNHHNHHDHHHHRPHQSSNCSSFVTGFSPTVTSMSRQRATTTSTTSSSSSTYPLQNSSSFSSSSLSLPMTCTKRTPRHSEHLLFSFFSTSSSNDLLLTKLLHHHWLPRVCLYLLTIRVSYFFLVLSVFCLIWKCVFFLRSIWHLGPEKEEKRNLSRLSLQSLGSRVVRPFWQCCYCLLVLCFYLCHSRFLLNLDDRRGRPLIIDMLFIFFWLFPSFLQHTTVSQSVSQSLARNLFLCSVQVGRKVFRSFESPFFYLLAQWWWFPFPSLSFALFYLHYHHPMRQYLYWLLCKCSTLQLSADGFVNGIPHCCLLCCSLEHPFPLSQGIPPSLTALFFCSSQSVSQSSTLSISFYFYSFLWKFYEKKRIYPSSVDSFSRFCPLFHFGPVFGGYCF